MLSYSRVLYVCIHIHIHIHIYIYICICAREHGRKTRGQYDSAAKPCSSSLGTASEVCSFPPIQLMVLVKQPNVCYV